MNELGDHLFLLAEAEVHTVKAILAKLEKILS